MSRATLRLDLDNAAGEAFLPEGWQRIVKHVGPLLAVADAAAFFFAEWDRDSDILDWDKRTDAADEALRAALATLEALP